MKSPILLSIQVGLPRVFADDGDTSPSREAFTTGFFKSHVDGPVWLGATNLIGDGQANLKSHGGLEKAVCVYPSEHYEYWEQVLHVTACSGMFGENFTTLGMLEERACIGDVVQIGEAICQISQPRPPCWKLDRCRRIDNLASQVERTGRTGWYLRVLQEGHVQSGASILLLRRPHPEWTVAAANDVLYNGESESRSVQALSTLPSLSASWRDYLLSRRT